MAFFALNTHRPLLRSALARRAINDAIDRPALAATLGPAGGLVTDQYLPPSISGGQNSRSIYPLERPDLGRARQLLHQAGVHLPASATLYTCNDPGCAARARILATDLRPLQIHLHIRAFPRGTEITRDNTPGAAYDIADEGYTYAVNDPSFLFATHPGCLTTGPCTAHIAHADELPQPQHDASLASIASELRKELRAARRVRHPKPDRSTLATARLPSVPTVLRHRLHATLPPPSTGVAQGSLSRALRPARARRRFAH